MKKHAYYSRMTSTQRAVKSFYRMLPKMGRVVKVRGKMYNASGKMDRVTFINDEGQQFVFYGFSWWYGGTGPSGLCDCLKLLGVPFEVREELREYRNKGTNDISKIGNSFVIHIGQHYRMPEKQLSEVEQKIFTLRHRRSDAGGLDLRYKLCDDWLIIAEDNRGRDWFVSTEVWHNWAELPDYENKAFEENSVEKYMLPIAFRNWESLSWRRADDDNSFSGINELDRINLGIS